VAGPPLPRAHGVRRRVGRRRRVAGLGCGGRTARALAVLARAGAGAAGAAGAPRSRACSSCCWCWQGAPLPFSRLSCCCCCSPLRMDSYADLISMNLRSADARNSGAHLSGWYFMHSLLNASLICGGERHSSPFTRRGSWDAARGGFRGGWWCRTSSLLASRATPRVW
jgi:hypothetical protein